eukprot:XP_017950937.1 PREDICTED: uncharacterized protein LOC108648043 [Xenopus tropicalis]
MSFADIAAITDRKAETFMFTETERKRILHAAQDLPVASAPTDMEILRKLEQLKRRNISWALHASALAEYVKAQRIPRGLRIMLQPALFKDDQEFVAKWRGILNRCSLDLITLTMQQLQLKSKDLKQQIYATEEEYKSISGTSTTNTLPELEHRLEKLQQEILQLKLRKFKRDTHDYEKGEVYTWKEARRHFRKHRSSLTVRPESSMRRSSEPEQDSPASSQSSTASFLGVGKRGGSARHGGDTGERLPMPTPVANRRGTCRYRR